MSLKWEGYRDHYFVALIELILNSLACMGILSLLILYFKIFYCNKATSNKSGYFDKFLLVSLVLSFLFIYSSYIINIILFIILGYRWNYGCFLRNVPWILVELQRMVVYAFYIIRLNVTFKGSIYAISTNKMRIIIILLVVTLGTALIPSVIFSYLMNQFSCTGIYSRYHRLSGAWYNIVDLSWCIILSVIYIKKFRQLIRDAKCDDMTSIVNKITILAFVTLISTLCVAIIIYSTFTLAAALSGIDLMFNNICIMLFFPVFKKSYKKYCCCCIKIQNKCCIEPNKPAISLGKEIQCEYSP